MATESLIKALVLTVFIGRTVSQLGTAKKCYEADGRPSRCMPEFVNAAYLKDISANNTCGLDGPSSYCAQSARIGLNKTCEICDASQRKLAHPASYVNDLVDENVKGVTWWQSDTTLKNKYPVRIILDLGKTFDITYIRITFHSSRPQSFAIFKRSSTHRNAKWEPFQYYSRTCLKSYRVPPGLIVKRENQRVALCSEKYSGITPMSGGNVAFSTLEGRPDRYGFDSSPVLQVDSFKILEIFQILLFQQSELKSDVGNYHSIEVGILIVGSNVCNNLPT